MKRGVFIFWSIFIAAAVFRLWQSFGVHIPDVGDCLKQTVNGIGVVSGEPERKEAGQILVIKVESAQAASGVACSSDFLIRAKTKLYPRFAYDDRISFTGKLSQPINFQSDGGRTFDFKDYLAKDDIFYEMKSATVALTSEKVDPTYIEGLSAALFSIRRRFVFDLESSLGEPHAALAAGLVVGEKAALGKDLLDDFRTVGLIHIVVLSGYNITVVGDAMRRMLSFLPRVWGIAIGGIGILLFGVMVGGGATVVRSCVMATIAVSANIIRRDYNVVRALGFAALIMIIESPMILLHDPSFQLSFLATVGLILLASPIESRLGFIPETFGMRGIIAATLATQIFVSPYILYMMGQLSVIGAVVNILVLPFIPLTMLAVFLTGAAGFIWLPLSHVVGLLAHLLLTYELFMVQNFAKLPFAALHIGVFSPWIVAAFYVIISALYVWFKINKKTT